ncbi:hypothetical protein G7066_09005 [Leucobacter coleopterorum]|uniref:TQXA domain-containing protein n=1 Tax=Leucobacter coleopterorum TaxID=2714933 RepID=A0ABX6K0Y5_9MICO|nr:hypothetical protein [Leucobacter coleopterorum]QIM18710.1 hypothetical protein G7066_09005 [Leucobacter coleopterorum]
MIRGKAFIVLLGILAGLLLMNGFPLSSMLPAAHAATQGAGHLYKGVFVGAFITSSTQSNAYCVEPDGDNPTSEVPPKVMSSLRGYRMQSTGHWVAPYSNERGLMQMNYITSMHGGLALGPGWHDDQAAAVALAIWTIRGAEDAEVAFWVANIRAAAPGHVQDQVDSILAESAAAIVPPVLKAPADPAVVWKTSATGVVDVPAGYQQLRIEAGGRLTGAAPTGVTFDSAAQTATLDSTRAVSLRFETTPDLGSSRLQEVKFSANWTKTGKRWPARIWGYQPAADDADQLLLYGGGSEDFSQSGTWRKTSATSEESRFAPVVRTEVPATRLEKGAPYADRVTFGIAEHSDPWPVYLENGVQKYRPVRATGTLYGPFASRPEESDEAPIDPVPPVAATAEVIAVDGPATYEVEISRDPAANVSGYFTWVWEIDAQSQGPEIQVGAKEEWHLDSRYSFHDRFGIPKETQFSPMEFNITTRLEDAELAPGGKTIDRITLASNGTWLERDGKPVPIIVRASVYETDGNPERAVEPPQDARLLATEKVTVTSSEAPSEIEVVAPFPEEPGRLVDGSLGLTVQACVVAEDQEEGIRELIEESCDDWGIPEESARVVSPQVATVAQETGQVGGRIVDTANVKGPVPEGATLGFTAYLKAEVGAQRFDEHWRPVLSEGESRCAGPKTTLPA